MNRRGFFRSLLGLCAIPLFGLKRGICADVVAVRRISGNHFVSPEYIAAASRAAMQEALNSRCEFKEAFSKPFSVGETVRIKVLPAPPIFEIIVPNGTNFIIDNVKRVRAGLKPITSRPPGAVYVYTNGKPDEGDFTSGYL